MDQITRGSSMVKNSTWNLNRKIPPSKIIGSILCTPSTVEIGQSVCVQVLDPSNVAYNNKQNAHISINGVPGSTQYMQFSISGQQIIFVMASLKGRIEHAKTTINVKSVKKTTYPILKTERILERPYSVRFSADHRTVSIGGTIKLPKDLAHVLPEDIVSIKDQSSVAASLGDEVHKMSTKLSSEDGLSPSKITQDIKHSTLLAKSQLLANLTNNLSNSIEIIAKKAKVKDSIAKYVAVDEYLNLRDISEVKPMSNDSFSWTASDSYKWDFGDGTSDETSEPYVEHDYGDSLDPNKEESQFHVTLTIKLFTGADITLKRTISIFNFYARMKKSGIIQPRIESSFRADRLGPSYYSTIIVKNDEDEDFTLTSYQISVMTNDPDHRPGVLPSKEISMKVTANSSKHFPVFALAKDVPHESPGFSIHFSGSTKSGKPVRVSVYLEIPAHQRYLGNFVSMKEAKSLTKIMDNKLIAVGNTVTTTDIERLSKRGLVDNRLFSSIFKEKIGVTKIGKGTTHAMSGESPEEGPVCIIKNEPIKEGNMCDPDNLPDNVPENWACQATPEECWVSMPARFINATKGDIVLSPDGNGLIGGLLTQVTPPQRYSHSGIMTRNYDQITHSTASQERLLHNPDPSGTEPLSNGFLPSALKYLWPGVITQTVQNAVNGEMMLDPETKNSAPTEQKFYSIQSFSGTPEGFEVGGVWEIVPPLVVKHDIKFETDQIRSKLEDVAKFALEQTGKSHYRFYCYTDPTIGLTEIAPSDAPSWAIGTYPTVCSSFIWKCLKNSGIMLEGKGPTVKISDLEIMDKQAGAQVDPFGATMDGLYLYTAEERLVAGQWLYETLYNMVSNVAEDWGIFWTDAADDIGNQVLNTFATDWSDLDAKDSDDWINTSPANAVSPDNILFWDSPANGGLYGYAEPLVYRPKRWEKLFMHRWKNVTKKSTLKGKVIFKGQPIEGATLGPLEGKFRGSDANGEFLFEDIHVGPYVVNALKPDQDQGGPVLKGSAPVTVTEGNNYVVVELKGPSEYYRHVVIDGWMGLHDADAVMAEAIQADQTWNFHRDLLLDKWNTPGQVSPIIHSTGGEVRGELYLKGEWRHDLSVRIFVDILLYEGTSEDTTDLDNEYHSHFDLTKNHTQWEERILFNADESDNDFIHVYFTAKNKVQNN